ncbi:MAG TPA: hypothetical protein VIL28_14095 [Steroidobacteraceae bacterium]
MSNPTRSHLAAFALGLIAALASANSTADDRLVDPTRPPMFKTPEPTRQSALKLEAVLSSGTTRVAIVNGKLVRAGDRIGAAHITEILAHGIRYTLNGRAHELHLGTYALPVKRPAAHEDET